MNRIDVVELVVDLVDVNLDVDLVGILFVVLWRNEVFVIVESFANTKEKLAWTVPSS